MYKDYDPTIARELLNSKSDCNCNETNDCTSKGTWGLDSTYPLASVYAPLQSFDKLFDMDTALVRGTVFSELDLPFMGDSVYKGGSCRG